MIENTENKTSADEEFERLLNEFIGSQECSPETFTDNLSQEESSQPLPSSQSPGYSFREPELILDGIDLMEEATNFKTSLHEYRFETSFHLYIPKVERIDRNTEEYVHILLYREGKRKPLVTGECEPNEDGLYFDMSNLTDNLKPGRYSLHLTNMKCDATDTRFEQSDGKVTFRFSLLPDGERIPHPQIKDIQVRRQDEPLTGTSGRLSLLVTLSRRMGTRDEFMAYCYDSSFQLMDKISISRSDDWPKTREVCFLFESPFIWMPGGYFCILSHNGEPFYRISFGLEPDKVTGCRGETILRNSPDHALMKHMERHRKYCLYWIKLRKTPGYGNVKRKVMEYFQDKVLDILRSDYGIGAIRRNMNFLCIGKERTDTISVINDFAFVLCPTRNFRYADLEEAAEAKNQPDPYADLYDILSMDDGVLCLSNISPLLDGNGQTFCRKLEKRMASAKKLTVFIRATAQEAEMLFETHPSLRRFFPENNRIQLEAYTLNDVVHSLQESLRFQSLALSTEAETRLARQMETLDKEGVFHDWGKEEVENLVQDIILPDYRRRILGTTFEDDFTAELNIKYLEPEDLCLDRLSRKNLSAPTDMDRLNGMVGLENVKQLLNSLFLQVQFRNIRRGMGLPHHEGTACHMVFTGNPGTGKTTVARLLGHIFQRMGILSKGDVIVTERSQMVGQFLGETEKNMRAILKEAQGNVLFIDEAYSLVAGQDNPKDFGYRAIECLLTVLAKPHPDMVVILAGYGKEMQKMLESNSGLKGRFPYILHFDDYTADELMEIAVRILGQDGFELSAEAHDCLHKTVKEAVARKAKDFSNARWIEQYVQNGIIPAMAERVIHRCDEIDKEICRRVEKEDVETAYRQFVVRRTNVIPRPAIGFRA